MAEPRDYLKDYLGMNPLDYSAIESQIAGQSPFASETASTIPTVSNLPKPRLLSEMDFQDLTAPLMQRVYGRAEDAMLRADDLASQLQALEAEKAQLAETETTRRAELEQQIQNLTQQRVEAEQQARSLQQQIETQAGDISGLEQQLSERTGTIGSLQEEIAGREQALQETQGMLQNTELQLQEITALRDQALADAEQARLEQDVIRQQASENLARSLEEQRQGLLSERESIIQSLEAEFGVERGQLEGRIGELESIKTGLESDINDLSSQINNLEAEKQDAIAQQDVIRAEAAQQQQDALAQQASQFDVERSQLQQQIDDLSAQVGQAPTGGVGEEPTGGVGEEPAGGAGEHPSDYYDPNDTPFDRYLRDQERLDAAVGMMPGGDAIQQGIEDLYGRVTAGGGKPEDFTIYKPPADMPSPETTPPPLAGGRRGPIPPQQPAFTPLSDRVDIFGAGKRYDPSNLPEGYSFQDTSGMMRTTVMPPAGFVYAYGPDGDRITVPSGEQGAAEMRDQGAARDQAFLDFQKTNPGEVFFGGLTPPSGLRLAGPPMRSGIPRPPGVPRQDRERELIDLGVIAPPRPLPSKPVGGVELPRSQQGMGSILFPPKIPTTPSPAPFNLRNQMPQPPMRFAGGGSLDQALYDLRSRLSK